MLYANVNNFCRFISFHLQIIFEVHGMNMTICCFIIKYQHCYEKKRKLIHTLLWQQNLSDSLEEQTEYSTLNVRHLRKVKSNLSFISSIQCCCSFTISVFIFPIEHSSKGNTTSDECYMSIYSVNAYERVNLIRNRIFFCRSLLFTS